MELQCSKVEETVMERHNTHLSITQWTVNDLRLGSPSADPSLNSGLLCAYKVAKLTAP